MNAAFVTLCAVAVRVESVNAIKPGLISLLDKKFPLVVRGTFCILVHSVLIDLIIAIAEISLKLLPAL